jgi:hypothetical protein
MTILRITAEDMSSDTPKTIADAHGDLDAIAYHVRRLTKDMSGEAGTQYTADITELEDFYGDETRKVATITGDADVVGYVLNKALRKERAQAITSREDAGGPVLAE